MRGDPAGNAATEGRSDRIARRRIDEVVIRPVAEGELHLRGRSGGGKLRWLGREPEVGEDDGDDVGVSDEGDHATTARAAGAPQHIDLVDTAQELGPG